MAFQLLVIAIFVALSIGHVVTTAGSGGLASTAPFFNDTSSFGTITAGAAIAAYSFLGFDAVTTLTEETIEPRKTIPRAILLVALIGGVVFIIVSYAAQLVRPGGMFDSPDAESSAAFYLARTIGDTLFSSIFL